MRVWASCCTIPTRLASTLASSFREQNRPLFFLFSAERIDGSNSRRRLWICAQHLRTGGLYSDLRAFGRKAKHRRSFAVHASCGHHSRTKGACTEQFRGWGEAMSLGSTH